jgi:hypothetical protein
MSKTLFPKKNKYGEIVFEDNPNFRPNLTPREMFKMGSFGGTYWRPIRSKFYKTKLRNKHIKYKSLGWWKSIHKSKLTTPFHKYDKTINYYGVKCGSTLEAWEGSGWMRKSHPYGWVQWYCDFYMGKRCRDDDRQLKRWIRTAGPKSRFRRALINLIIKKEAEFDNYEISPVRRQTLQHWGYKLTKRDFLLNRKEYDK